MFTALLCKGHHWGTIPFLVVSLQVPTILILILSVSRINYVICEYLPDSAVCRISDQFGHSKGNALYLSHRNYSLMSSASFSFSLSSVAPTSLSLRFCMLLI